MKKNTVIILIVLLIILLGISWAKVRKQWLKSSPPAPISEPVQQVAAPAPAAPQQLTKVEEATPAAPTATPGIRETKPAKYAKDSSTETKGFMGIEFLTGFMWGKLKEKGNIHYLPFIAGFDFNLKPLVEKLNIHPKQLIQFQIEPFVSFIYDPKSNFEIGNLFFFKVGIFPETWKFQPYVKAGAGFDYMTQHIKEQGSQFNFIEQGGLGFHYFFCKNTAITIEALIRHLSNAGIADPNHGINTYSVNAGIYKKF